MSHALIYGGNGALGKSLVSHFIKHQWKVISVDLIANPQATSNILLDLNDSWTQQEAKITEEVGKVLSGAKLNAIVCVAGGWAGGNSANQDLIKTCELMWKQSVQSSVIAAKLAALHLDMQGLLVLTGAKAALEGTPGMIGYGMAKAAVHQLSRSLASKGSGLPDGAKVATILPITLDTPANRAAMPKADFSSWTPCDIIAEQVLQWTQKLDGNGKLWQIVTEKAQTKFTASQL